MLKILMTLTMMRLSKSWDHLLRCCWSRLVRIDGLILWWKYRYGDDDDDVDDDNDDDNDDDIN